MLTLIHNNPVELTNGELIVDRKFHVGMLNYCEALRAEVLSVNPLARPGERVMDPVSIPLSQLPYKVHGLGLDARGRPFEEDRRALDALIARSALVVGYGYDTTQMTRRHGTPCIVCLEYDLGTQLTVASSFARNPIRAAWSMLRCTQDYVFKMIPAMKSAREIHCNGYPIFAAAAAYNARRLLYLDSRMSSEMVIPAETLRDRLAVRRQRPVRLIYSGRYERMKGALDAVKAAAICRQRGLEFEMDCYGQGGLASEMRAVAAAAGPSIRVHDAIPFPELVRRTHDADLFICCHIQSDPSCTYLESMGAGLPIAGYSNRMWAAMAEASNAGVVTAHNSPAAMADEIERLIARPDDLDQMSCRARDFATRHTFEMEFQRRTDAINAALEEGR